MIYVYGGFFTSVLSLCCSPEERSLLEESVKMLNWLSYSGLRASEDSQGQAAGCGGHAGHHVRRPDTWKDALEVRRAI